MHTLTAVDQRPACQRQGAAVVQRNAGCNRRLDGCQLFLDRQRRGISGISHALQIRIALSVDALNGSHISESVGGVCFLCEDLGRLITLGGICICLRGSDGDTGGVVNDGRLDEAVGQEGGAVALFVLNGHIRALIHHRKTVDDSADAVRAVYGGRTANVGVIDSDGDHFGRAAAVKEDSVNNTQLLAHIGQIHHAAGRTSAVCLRGGGQHHSRTVSLQANDGAGVLGGVGGLTRLATALQEGKEAADHLLRVIPLISLCTDHGVTADHAGDRRAVAYLKSAGL